MSLTDDDKMVPKIIMQTWKNKEVPDIWKESIQSIKEIMPDWKHVLMTDEENRNLVKEHFPDFLSYYDNFPYPIQRADAVRYIWLYLYGGIYMDLDIAVQKDLSPILGNEDFYLVTSGNIGTSFTNSFMISKPKVDFWLQVIEEMKKPVPSWCATKQLIVMNSTGPLMLSRVAKNYNKKFGFIPAKQFNDCNVCNHDICNSPDNYTKVLRGQSWCGWDSKFLNFCLCYGKKLMIYISVFLIVIILFFVLKRYL